MSTDRFKLKLRLRKYIYGKIKYVVTKEIWYQYDFLTFGKMWGITRFIGKRWNP